MIRRVLCAAVLLLAILAGARADTGGWYFIIIPTTGNNFVRVETEMVSHKACQLEAARFAQKLTPPSCHAMLCAAQAFCVDWSNSVATSPTLFSGRR